MRHLRAWSTQPCPGAALGEKPGGRTTRTPCGPRPVKANCRKCRVLPKFSACSARHIPSFEGKGKETGHPAPDPSPGPAERWLFLVCSLPSTVMPARPRRTRDSEQVEAALSPDRLQDIRELLRHLLAQLRRRARDLGKILQPLERPAGVDHGARVGRACLVEDRVERARPGAAEGLDVLRRIAARADR